LTGLEAPSNVEEDGTAPDEGLDVAAEAPRGRVEKDEPVEKLGLAAGPLEEGAGKGIVSVVGGKIPSDAAAQADKPPWRTPL